MEKVAYVLGLDASSGTYITDFILSGLCILYSLLMLSCTGKIRRATKSNKSENKFEQSHGESKQFNLLQAAYTQARDLHTQTISISVVFLSCALMHMAGGVAHVRVNDFESESRACTVMTSLDSDYDIMTIECFRQMLKPLLPLYVIWQIANFFACLYADSTLLLIPYAIIDVVYRPRVVEAIEKDKRTEEENCHREDKENKSRLKGNIRKILLFFLILEVIIVTAQLCYYTSNILSYFGHFERNFTAEETTLTTQVGINSASVINLNHADIGEAFGDFWTTQPAVLILFCVFFVYSTTTTILALLPTGLGHRRHQNLQEKRVSPQWTISGSTESSSGISKPFSRKSSSQFRLKYVHTLRSLGTWTIFISGMIQYGYSTECGKNEPVSCPFPISFNHNAVYHSLTAFGISTWFFAEYKNCKEEVTAIAAVKLKND